MSQIWKKTKFDPLSLSLSLSWSNESTGSASIPDSSALHQESASRKVWGMRERKTENNSNLENGYVISYKVFLFQFCDIQILVKFPRSWQFYWNYTRKKKSQYFFWVEEWKNCPQKHTRHILVSRNGFSDAAYSAWKCLFQVGGVGLWVSLSQYRPMGRTKKWGLSAHIAYILTSNMRNGRRESWKLLA